MVPVPGFWIRRCLQEADQRKPVPCARSGFRELAQRREFLCGQTLAQTSGWCSPGVRGPNADTAPATPGIDFWDWEVSPLAPMGNAPYRKKAASPSQSRPLLGVPLAHVCLPRPLTSNPQPPHLRDADVPARCRGHVIRDLLQPCPHTLSCPAHPRGPSRKLNPTHSRHVLEYYPERVATLPLDSHRWRGGLRLNRMISHLRAAVAMRSPLFPDPAPDLHASAMETAGVLSEPCVLSPSRATAKPSVLFRGFTLHITASVYFPCPERAHRMLASTSTPPSAERAGLGRRARYIGI